MITSSPTRFISASRRARSTRTCRVTRADACNPASATASTVVRCARRATGGASSSANALGAAWNTGNSLVAVPPATSRRRCIASIIAGLCSACSDAPSIAPSSASAEAKSASIRSGASSWSPRRTRSSTDSSSCANSATAWYPIVALIPFTVCTARKTTLTCSGMSLPVSSRSSARLIADSCSRLSVRNSSA